jgi:hypothetical protein
MVYLGQNVRAAVGVLVLSGILLVGCGPESKEVQCQKLKNAFESVRKKVQESDIKSFDNPEDATKLAGIIDEVVGEFRGLGLTDEKLKGTQDLIVDLLSQMNSAIRELPELAKTKNPADIPKVFAVVQKVQKAAEQLPQSLKDSEEYCGTSFQ